MAEVDDLIDELAAVAALAPRFDDLGFESSALANLAAWREFRRTRGERREDSGEPTGWGVPASLINHAEDFIVFTAFVRTVVEPVRCMAQIATALREVDGNVTGFRLLRTDESPQAAERIKYSSEDFDWAAYAKDLDDGTASLGLELFGSDDWNQGAPVRG